MFKEIGKSASKLVFIGIALTMCTAYIAGIVTGSAVLETKDFMFLAGMAFTFYFANKGEIGVPYAGK